MVVNGIKFPANKIEEFKQVKSFVDRYNYALDRLEALGFNVGEEQDGHIFLEYLEKENRFIILSNY